jgi:serine/threonine-protein kinase
MVIGSVLAERYRIDQSLVPAQAADASAPQGVLWRGADLLASDAPVALRQLADPTAQARFRALWPAMQAVLHPQIPRFGGLLEQEEMLWLVREWQQGTPFDQIQQQRAERQLVFGSGEVLLLLRQLLPALAVLHAKGLVHGDLNPSNLLRRDQDGLPVLIDFGLLQRQGEQPIAGATAGFAPQAQGRGEPAAAWMDLHGLGVTALVLLTGRRPEELLDDQAVAWVVPETVELEPPFRQALVRLLSEQPGERFEQAVDALKALQAVVMPESTGPIARSERTLVLAPAVQDMAVEEASRLAQDLSTQDPSAQASPDLPPLERPGAAAEAGSAGVASSERRPLPRQQERQQAAEGRLWPVVGALLVSAVVGTAIGWFLISRGTQPGGAPSTDRDLIGRVPQPSLPAEEVDQRQQLLSRLRALQIDRSWFLRLVDDSLLAQYPERNGRLPGESLEDAPLRRAWNELAEEWLARVEQLSPALRGRLGRLKAADWRKQRELLTQQGVDARVVEQLVTASAQNLLPGVAAGAKPAEPYLQLWYAAAMRSLDDVRIEAVTARPREATVLSSRVKAGGARLISIQVPKGRRLVLGINGTPLMQMTVYGGDGAVVAERGPLRVVTLNADAGSPVQVLVTNEGVSSGVLTLSCRADRPPAKPLPAVDPNPIPDPATGVSGAADSLVDPPGPRPAGVPEPAPVAPAPPEPPQP